MSAYYHAAPPWYAEAIEREGLRPDTDVVSLLPSAVHLTVNRVYVSAAALHGCADEELAVWEVDLSGLDEVRPGWDGDYDEDGTKEFAAVYVAVPPERLRRMAFDEWQAVGEPAEGPPVTTERREPVTETTSSSDALRNDLRRRMVKFLVQREIFCPVTKTVLDVRTCVVLVDQDGDPTAVISQEGWQRTGRRKRALLAGMGVSVELTTVEGGV